MSAQPQSIATTIRGKAALGEVRDLLDHLAKVDADIEALDAYPRTPLEEGSKPLPMAWPTISDVEISFHELRAVIQRRHDVLCNTLQNKGIRIAPDPDTPASSAASEITSAAPMHAAEEA